MIPEWGYNFAFNAGVIHQENQQLLCLAEIRSVLGDKEGKLTHDQLLDRIKAREKVWKATEES